VTLGLITWAVHLKSTTSEAIELNLRSDTQNKMDCQMHCKNWRLRKRMLEILRRLKAARQTLPPLGNEPIEVKNVLSCVAS
jgi:hypothetical protein